MDLFQGGIHAKRQWGGEDYFIDIVKGHFIDIDLEIS